MAQTLEGRLTDYALEGLTSFNGRITTEGAGTTGSVPARGVVAAGGLYGRIVVVEAGAHVLSSDYLGATFIFSNRTASTITLPGKRAGVAFRFVVGQVPDTGSHVVNLADGDGGLLFGGLSVGDSVPPAVFAQNRSSLAFTDMCSVGDRVDVISDGQAWYIADGLVASSAGISIS